MPGKEIQAGLWQSSSVKGQGKEQRSSHDWMNGKDQADRSDIQVDEFEQNIWQSEMDISIALGFFP